MSDFSRLDALLDKFSNTTLPGCSCTIMQEDKVIYQKEAGYSDLERKKPLTEHSMYRQASTTKLFTYAIVGMLYEEGKFLFSDPVSEYLPEWKESKVAVKNARGGYDFVTASRPLTIKDAVTMTCGLPYCMFPDPSSTDPTTKAMSEHMTHLLKDGKRPVLREEVRAMADVPLRFEPGSHWLYGFGSEITGAIVEVLEQKALRDVFAERVIDPLELHDTATYIDEIVAEKLVSYYRKSQDGSFVNISENMDRDLMEEFTPRGARVGLMASTRDFAVFMQMLANGGIYGGRRFLSEGTVRMLSSNYLNEIQLKDFHCDYLDGYGYGYGFRTLMDKAAGNHNGSLGSFGWTGGSGIWVEADPVRKVSIAYMHNMSPNEELYHHHRVRTVANACLGMDK